MVEKIEESPFISAEMVDREERKALKKKLEEEEQLKKAKRDEIESVLNRSKISEQKKTRNKKIIKNGAIIIAIGLVFWLIKFLFDPFKVNITYGICKTYLELNVQFPQELRYNSLDDLGDSMRIWYTQIDAFGENRQESIQCFFEKDPVLGARIDKILINRREVPAEKVEAFNKILSAVLRMPLDLDYPETVEDRLQGLKIDTDSMRKPILDKPVNNK